MPAKVNLKTFVKDAIDVIHANNHLNTIQNKDFARLFKKYQTPRRNSNSILDKRTSIKIPIQIKVQQLLTPHARRNTEEENYDSVLIDSQDPAIKARSPVYVYPKRFKATRPSLPQRSPFSEVVDEGISEYLNNFGFISAKNSCILF